ncbi:squalene/phytoene synthase family protein [Asticcacaulis sp. ZE23SCel15]|uniref:squalene/phytoene synthase family protein n=1 Tax=Asticcacaulis sp. ZE23SCel15 TaxID=3059027 RepID=UPI00265DF856|nr:squalene/phytoene synthase family protein [Asticcacaulis sp. ZE23SCel15]WKL56856.1 squalene/phytoene synthase family protein [Asticcacaulis sp. ZE23SCel15]
MSDDDLTVKNEDLLLSSAFIDDAVKRADIRTLYAFFDVLREVPERVTQPLMGEIRLRWWYEAVEEIMAGAPVRYHPLSAALEDMFGRYALDGQMLLDLIEGQMVLLDKQPLSHKDALTLADRSEVLLARIAAQVLDPNADATALAEPARYYALARLHAGQMIAPPAPLFNALRAEAKAAFLQIPPSLVALIAHAALAKVYAAQKHNGPLMRRFKVFLAFLTARL